MSNHRTQEQRRDSIRRLVAWMIAKHNGGLGPDDPKTQDEFAEAEGVSSRTIYAYKKDQFFKDLYRRASMDAGQAAEVRQQVLGELLELARDKEASDTARVNAYKAVLGSSETILERSGSDDDLTPDSLEDLDLELADVLKNAETSITSESNDELRET